MLCGAAQNLDQMVLFRLLQGVFGAALVPLSQSIMLDLYPPHKRGQAMAIFSLGVMVGPILGPTLGGYLTDFYNWRWVFYVNFPLGAVALVGIVLFFRDTHRDATLKFDWLGFSILGIGVGALQLMLDRGTTLGWFDSQEVIVEAVLAGLGLYLFVVHLVLSKDTFIRRGMFSDRNFVSSLAVIFVLSLSIFASTALLPPYLQTLGGYSVRQTGFLDGATRCRQRDLDAVGRTLRDARRRASYYGAGRRNHVVGELGNVTLDPRSVSFMAHDDHLRPGAGDRHVVRADEFGGLCDAARCVQNRRRGHFQPDAQHGQRHRDIDHLDNPRHEYANRTCAARTIRQSVQPQSGAECPEHVVESANVLRRNFNSTPSSIATLNLSPMPTTFCLYS